MHPHTRKLLRLQVAGADVGLEDILDWALETDGGCLPADSARAFAVWLDKVWEDWTDDESATVEGVLKGAVEDWCGGRVMPS